MTGFAWANSRQSHTHTNFSSNKCESLKRNYRMKSAQIICIRIQARCQLQNSNRFRAMCWAGWAAITRCTTTNQPCKVRATPTSLQLRTGINIQRSLSIRIRRTRSSKCSRGVLRRSRKYHLRRASNWLNSRCLTRKARILVSLSTTRTWASGTTRT